MIKFLYCLWMKVCKVIYIEYLQVGLFGLGIIVMQLVKKCVMIFKFSGVWVLGFYLRFFYRLVFGFFE